MVQRMLINQNALFLLGRAVIIYAINMIVP